MRTMLTLSLLFLTLVSIRQALVIEQQRSVIQSMMRNPACTQPTWRECCMSTSLKKHPRVTVTED